MATTSLKPSPDDPHTDAFWEKACPVVLANPGHPAAVNAAQSVRQAVDTRTFAPDIPPPAGLIHFLTSGSSGHPKAVGFTRAALLASARAVNAFLEVTPADTWLRVLPAFHVGGFAVAARAWAAQTRYLSLDSRWNPAAFAALCAREKVTLTSLVPTQVFDLVQAGLGAPPPLRTILVGGGPLRPALHHQARSLGWPVRASYGLTEAASTVAIEAATESVNTRLTVLPHWHARIGKTGLLHLRGPARPYHIGTFTSPSSPPRWHRVHTLHTSDRARLDGTTLVFLGRADRVVKRLGELIDLEQLDQSLADAAHAAGALGRVRLRCSPHPRDGHQLVLECLDAAEGAAVAARFNATQPAYARLHHIQQVPDLHLSPLGKPLA